MKQITLEDGTKIEISDKSYTDLQNGINKVTYRDVVKGLFLGNDTCFINTDGTIDVYLITPFILEEPHLGTEQQLEGLLALNKLMNVARYLNEDAVFENGGKYYSLYINSYGVIKSDSWRNHRSMVKFYTEQLAREAVEILGEKEITKALTWSY